MSRAPEHPADRARRDAPAWEPEHPLVRVLTAAPHEFEFFQLVHLAESRAGGARLGREGPAREERLRLRPALSFAFPAADVQGAEWRDQPGQSRLLITATFLGLYGTASPMPSHLTESLIREREEDQRIRDFLDLLHHRLLSLLYRVWVKYRHYVTFESAGHDPISEVVRGILGLGTPDLDRGLSIGAVRLFRYAGLLAQRPRSAAGLIGCLRDYFPGVDFDVEQCVPRWVNIEPADQNRLGTAGCTLGSDFMLGERVRDRSGLFRVRVGPVGLAHFAEFLPPGRLARELRTVVSFYCGDPLSFDVEVTLRGDEVPELPLGEHGTLGRLGWTSWARSHACGDRSVVFSAPRSQRPA